MSAPVVTRFAPSPTGYLHIGGARTALFNWLFARGRGGKFLLRIEDTDRARSTPEATDAIFAGLKWLGLDWDDEPVSQHARIARHAEVAADMLARGAAYKCFSTADDIDAFREAARAAGQSTLFRSPWRDVPESDHPDAPFALRVKAPRDGETVIRDAVQGDVIIRNDQLDDMIVLRSDGTPVYMLAVVVDDHDMGVTHVIRGDDHLNNAARQMLVYSAMGWDVPTFAHIPLIHGEDGKKLSKRHGALGVEAWAAEGFPATAMRNYLARLGWAHGDDEFFSTAQATEWFALDGIKKSPARLDGKKLLNLSGQHIAAAEADSLLAAIDEFCVAAERSELTPREREALKQTIPVVQSGCKKLSDILDKSHFLLTNRPIAPDEKAAKSLDSVSRGILTELTAQLQNVSWSRDTLEHLLGAVVDERGMKFGQLAGPLRAALAGRTATPSVYDMMLILGPEETLARLTDAAE